MAADLFDPSISYRADNSGTGIRIPDLTELIAAFTESNAVLLIHGYNNDEIDATASYNNFKAHLLSSGRAIAEKLVAVYWPGSNWEGGLFYMQAIPQAKKVALVIAKTLCDTAKAKKYLKIDIVTHSLGGRVALETVKEILRLQAIDPAPLVIGRISMMAGAVPVAYLAEMSQLQAAINGFQATQSLYSYQDLVLHYAFPAGETLAGEGFLPVALGRKNWSPGSSLLPGMDQQENKGANHGDYWGAESSKKITEQRAADWIYNFLNLGPNVSRTPASRDTAGPRTILARPIPDGRSVAVRTV